VQPAHARHLGLAAQAGELSPRALLRQQFDQQVHRMHRRQQAQQMEPIQLGRTVLPPPPARVARRPALADEIVGHKRIEEFKQGRRAGGRKVGIHVRSLPLEFQPVSDHVAPPGILAACDYPGDGCTNFRNTLFYEGNCVSAAAASRCGRPFQPAQSGCAPVKLAATRVRVPPVELDCSRPKARSGKRPRGRTRKHDPD
jgi:hypothetical protein